MTTATETYLARLRAAVGTLPSNVGADIVAGISEELRGLDETDARTRIAELGDPERIAAAARDEVGTPPVAEGRTDDSTPYTVITALLLLAGGLVVPIVGWIAGVIMLWYSKTWTLRDKLIGTLLTPLTGALILVLSLPASVVMTTEQLIPTPHIAVLAVIVLLPLPTFVYLLARARSLKRSA